MEWLWMNHPHYEKNEAESIIFFVVSTVAKNFACRFRRNRPLHPLALTTLAAEEV